MLSPAVNNLLSAQVKWEFFSANLYFALASWCDTHKFIGCGHYLYKNGEEELKHAVDFLRFTNENGGSVTMEAIPKPEFDFGEGCTAVRAIFKKVLEHEIFVTNKIKSISKAALDNGEFGVLSWLDKYNKEQLEEVAKAQDTLDLLDLTPDNMVFTFDLKLNE